MRETEIIVNVQLRKRPE